MKEKMWTFELMVALANANNVIEESERTQLEKAVQEMFETDEERQSALEAIRKPSDPGTLLENLPSPVVTAQSFGFRLLSQCVELAAIDGEICDNESAFLYELGRFYRFDPDFVTMFLDEARASLQPASAE